MSNVQSIERINNKRQPEKELVTGWRQLQLQYKIVLLKQPANLKESPKLSHVYYCELMATQKLVTSPPQHAL